MIQIAHSLKSTSASFGALTLSSLCKEMENMGRMHTTSGAQELLQKITAEYIEVEKALVNELQAGAP
jgi:HPt (histidine-containing phosphotransfer) domain-containing protein